MMRSRVSGDVLHNVRLIRNDKTPEGFADGKPIEKTVEIAGPRAGLSLR